MNLRHPAPPPIAPRLVPRLYSRARLGRHAMLLLAVSTLPAAAAPLELHLHSLREAPGQADWQIIEQSGQNVALLRDLTDSMYDSRQRPFVDHFTGNDLVAWRIEKYWFPAITSDQIIGGTPFRFSVDAKLPRRYAANAGPAASSHASMVFDDAFGTSLNAAWSWLRENRDAWRLRDGALEIRVEPGDAHTVRNALLMPAPDRSRGRYQVEVTVRNLTIPTQQFEQAGITWYSNGQPVLKLVKELVDGELMIIPGRKPMTHELVHLRLTVDAGRYVAEFRPNAEGPFLTAASGDLPPATNEQLSLQCYHGPTNAEHWIRFDDFRIWQLHLQ